MDAPKGKKVLLSCFSPNLERIPRDYLQPSNVGAFRNDPGAVCRLLLEAYGDEDDRVQSACRLARRVVEMLEFDLRSPSADLFIDAAAGGQRSEVVRRLKAGQAPDAKHSVTGYSAMHLACDFGRLSVVKVLLAWGGDVQVERDSDGGSPLHCAAEHGHAHVVRCLLEAGADKTRLNRHGLKAFDLAREGHHELAMDLLHEPPDAPDYLGVSNVTARGATLRWRRPSDNGIEIEDYEITLVPVNGVEVAQFPERRGVARVIAGLGGASTLFSFAGELVPSTEYLVCVRARNAAGWGPMSHEADLATRVDVPERPSPPAATSSTCVSLELAWEPPANNNGGTIYNYELHVTPGPATATAATAVSRGDWVPVADRIPGATIEMVSTGAGNVRKDTQIPHLEFSVTGLRPGTAYAFRVRCQNKVGWGEWSEESATLRTRPPASALEVHARSVTLQWGDLAAVGTHDAPAATLAEGKQQPQNDDDVDDDEFSDEAKQREAKHEGKHEPPPTNAAAAAVGRVEAWQLQRTVLDPEAFGGDAAAAAVEAAHSAVWTDISSKIVATSHCVRKLVPATWYVFRVRPNVVGEGWMRWEDCAVSEPLRTLAATPDEPAAPTPVAKTHRSVTLRWTQPRSNGLPVTGYALRLASQHDGSRWSNVRAERALDADTLEYEVVGLVSGHERVYVFQVRAQNELGWSPFSSSSAAVSTNALPPPNAPTVVSKTDCFMTLEWTMPPLRQGAALVHVEKYELQMKCLKRKMLGGEGGGEEGEWEVLSDCVREECFVVRELAPVTEYLFRVRAHCHSGWSNLSELGGPFRTTRRF